MVMKMRGDKCHPGRGKRVKIPLLPNNVGKKSANDAVPQQGHDSSNLKKMSKVSKYTNYVQKVLFHPDVLFQSVYDFQWVIKYINLCYLSSQ